MNATKDLAEATERFLAECWAGLPQKSESECVEYAEQLMIELKAWARGRLNYSEVCVFC